MHLHLLIHYHDTKDLYVHITHATTNPLRLTHDQVKCFGTLERAKALY